MICVTVGILNFMQAAFNVLKHISFDLQIELPMTVHKNHASGFSNLVKDMCISCQFTCAVACTPVELRLLPENIKK